MALAPITLIREPPHADKPQVDDDNILKSGQLPTDLRDVMADSNGVVHSKLPELLVEAGVHLYNPYAESFKSHSRGERVFSWQRGFPLEEIRNANTYQQRNVSFYSASGSGFDYR